jgi:hypothetical protein
MARRQKTARRPKPKTALRLPGLEQSKNTVLNSLAAASFQESYGHAIGEFIGWYCPEPLLAFNRTVVLRHRFFLEQNSLAPPTINMRLAACGGLPMKPPIPARFQRPASAAIADDLIDEFNGSCTAPHSWREQSSLSRSR